MTCTRDATNNDMIVSSCPNHLNSMLAICRDVSKPTWGVLRGPDHSTPMTSMSGAPRACDSRHPQLSLAAPDDTGSPSAVTASGAKLRSRCSKQATRRKRADEQVHGVRLSPNQ